VSASQTQIYSPPKKNFNLVIRAAPPRLGIFGGDARRAHGARRNGLALIQVFCTNTTTSALSGVVVLMGEIEQEKSSKMDTNTRRPLCFCIRFKNQSQPTCM